MGKDRFYLPWRNKSTLNLEERKLQVLWSCMMAYGFKRLDGSRKECGGASASAFSEWLALALREFIVCALCHYIQYYSKCIVMPTLQRIVNEAEEVRCSCR